MLLTKTLAPEVPGEPEQPNRGDEQLQPQKPWPDPLEAMPLKHEQVSVVYEGVRIESGWYPRLDQSLRANGWSPL